MTNKMYQAKLNGAMLLPDSVTAAQLAPDSVGASEIASGAVTGRGPTLLVAASNASTAVKEMADYICDNSADQVEINAALTALPAGGGRVLLSEGTFTISGAILTAKANSTLQGQGFGTLITVPNTTAANTSIVQLAHAGCLLRDVKIDGNKANNAGATSMIGVYVTAANCRVENVWVLNSAAVGFQVVTGGDYLLLINCIADACASTFGAFMDQASYCQLISCISRSNTAAGFWGSGASSAYENCLAVSNGGSGFFSSGANLHYADCKAISNSGNGFYNTTGVGVQHVGCLARSNSSDGFLVGAPKQLLSGCAAILNVASGFSGTSSGAYSTIDGCLSQGNAQHGISINGGHFRITNNTVMENGTQIADTFSNIVLTTGADNCYVDGNFVRRGVSGNRCGYGINNGNTGASANNYIGLNDLFEAGTVANFADGGQNTRRSVKRQLTYTAGVIHAGTAIAAGTETTVVDTASLPFRVDNVGSVIQVNVRLAIHIDITAAGTSIAGSSVRIDSASGATMTGMIVRLGGVRLQVSGENYVVPGGSFTLVGLAVGPHTLKIVAQSDLAGLMYVRGMHGEFCEVEVVEYAT